jgi:hypothetical protein
VAGQKVGLAGIHTDIGKILTCALHGRPSLVTKTQSSIPKVSTMADSTQGTARCVPPNELIRHSLHVLTRDGSESYARWLEGRWIFGHSCLTISKGSIHAPIERHGMFGKYNIAYPTG